MKVVKIFIVEDEMIIAADLSLELEKLGYEVSGISPRGEDALKSIEATPPDIVLMDIALKGQMNGIDAAHQVRERFHIPVVFLTANADDQTFQLAKGARPYAFLSKPFQVADLKRTLELVVQRMEEESLPEATDIAMDQDESFILSDRIFVRHKDRMVKVYIDDILFAEADRNYCLIHTNDKEFLLSVPLRVLEEKVPQEQFMRVHRSYVVNLSKIDALTDNQEFLVLGNKNVSISRRYKEAVLKRLKLI